MRFAEHTHSLGNELIAIGVSNKYVRIISLVKDI